MPMTPIRLFAGCVAAAIAFIAAASAMAQSPVTRLRGSIAANDGKTVTIATREGTQVPVKLADNYAVMLVSPVSLANIKENSFVGIASMKAPDGSLNALEVLVFPEAARGTGEGHYPWDLQPESTMTNATVATLAATPKGQEMTLTFKGETNKVIVPAGVPIVTFEPGDKAMLKPGAKVFVGTTKAADGSLSAGRVNVGKDGLTPPM
jgi:hypothetical protein